MSDAAYVATGLVDADWAFDRYEALRSRLPSAAFPQFPKVADTLADVADAYDAFVLDAFGVLNVGNSPIPGAVDRIAALRRAGKRVVVLTNAASYTRTEAIAKYRRLGFDFSPDEIVASRDVAAARLDRIAPGTTWAAITQAGDDLHDIAVPSRDAIADPAALDEAGGILFLSSARWTPGLQSRLISALREAPRPLVVANPDLVAPREDGLTVEPGAFAHEIADRTGLAPVFFGKPFQDAFDDAAARFSDVSRNRIAMVGDTLHTDVLGGAAAGMGTVLVLDHGLFAGRAIENYLSRSGIVPDHIVATT